MGSIQGQRVELDRVHRFKAQGPVTVHRDGEPFYVFGAKERGFHFTLPPGSYRIEGGALLPGKPHTPKAAPRPRVALRFPFPREVVVKWTDNGNTASIDLLRGVIYADRSLLRLPVFVRLFVLFHEIGHYWHRDEESCDRFACDQMIARGYNPSQCVVASNMTLKRSPGRGIACFQHAKTLNR